MYKDLRIFLKNPFRLGFFRFTLAISVVVAHSASISGANIADAVVAVQSFYIISGFLMTLILTQKYHSYNSFIKNRVLRLFPVYYCVLFFAIITSVISYYGLNNSMYLQSWISNIRYLNITTIFFLIFTNIAIIGQDVLMFLGINPQGTLFFTTNFYDVNLPAFTFLFIPQTWTLGVELIFYLIAPFLVKLKTKYLIMLFGLSLALRILFYSKLGLHTDPWNYRFFPFELIFFIAGIISFKFYLKLKRLNIDFNYLNKFAFLLFIFVVFFNFIPINIYIKMILVYCMVCFALPSLFNQSNQSNLDKKIGNYSYAIYIVHNLVISVLIALSINIELDLFLFVLLSTTLSVIFAVFLFRYIEKPVSKIRNEIVENQ